MGEELRLSVNSPKTFKKDQASATINISLNETRAPRHSDVLFVNFFPSSDDTCAILL